jgi:hypothetical protein
VITMPEAERARVLAAVCELGAAQAARSPAGRLMLPYVTECFRTDLL